MLTIVKGVISNLSGFILVLIVIFGVIHLNRKLNKMNAMWMDANQVIVKNQQQQIEVNRAYSNQLDALTSHISGLNEKDRIQWMQSYHPEIQVLLKTPPDGLKPQGVV